LNKTLGFLILAIILKVIFKNIVGAEHTSIDGLYYVGSFWGSFAYILLEGNLDLLKLKFYKFRDLLSSMITFKLDGDSDSESESFKGRKVYIWENGKYRRYPDSSYSSPSTRDSSPEPHSNSEYYNQEGERDKEGYYRHFETTNDRVHKMSNDELLKGKPDFFSSLSKRKALADFACEEFVVNNPRNESAVLNLLEFVDKAHDALNKNPTTGSGLKLSYPYNSPQNHGPTKIHDDYLRMKSLLDKYQSIMDPMQHSILSSPEFKKMVDDKVKYEMSKAIGDQ